MDQTKREDEGKQTTASLEKASGFSIRDVMRPKTMQQLMWLAGEIAKSKVLLPRDLQNDPMLVVALIEFGEHVGMGLMESVQNVCLINGKFSIYGDRLLAIVLASGLVEDHEETWERDAKGVAISATCRIRRKNRPTECVRTYRMETAVNAGLLRNPTWKNYPERMLQMRARGFALRDLFPDVLGGLITREEAEDYAYDVTTGKKVERPRRDRTVDANALSERRAADRESPPAALTETPRPESDDHSLGVVLRGIDMATTLEHLSQISEVAKALPEADAIRARQAFVDKRRELSVEAAPPLSKAQRMLREREAKKTEESPSDYFAGQVAGLRGGEGPPPDVEPESADLFR